MKAARPDPAARGPAGSVFHVGELATQAWAGAPAAVQAMGPRMIRDHLIDQHRAFFAQLPFVVLCARDTAGRPWVSLVAGALGFAAAPTASELHVAATLGEDDPLEGALRVGAPLGLLGIELPTRRRNRLNGHVSACDARGFTVTVRESFGNCPQYITPRSVQHVDPPGTPGSSAREAKAGTRGDAAKYAPRAQQLSPAQVALIERADTFFIGTGANDDVQDGAGGLDASHRGGPPGFVRVDDARHLVFPDYAGNNLYNTLGNLACDARAGLLFVDFATGAWLHLTGRAEVLWDSPRVTDFVGARRLVRFELDECVSRSASTPLRFG